MNPLLSLKYNHWSDIVSPLQAIICDIRPSQLSDPFDEFTLDELREILDKEPQDLGVKEYMNLFHTNLPAGNFQECAFYVPYALQYIHTHLNDSECIEVVGRVNFWVNTQKEELEKLNFLTYFHDFSLDLYKRCFAISPFDSGNWDFFYARMVVVRELCDNVSDGWLSSDIFLEVMDYLKEFPCLFRSLCLISIYRHLNVTYKIFCSKGFLEQKANMMRLFKSKFDNQFLTDSRSALRDYSAYYFEDTPGLEFSQFLMQEDDIFED